MQRRRFIQNLGLISAVLFQPKMPNLLKNITNRTPMKVRLLRNATLMLEIGKYKFLVDPMLGDKDSMPPIEMASNNIRIPMVDLPISHHELNILVNEIDAVIITHTHRDHWDQAAQELIPKDKLLIGQPEDEATFKAQGFSNIQSVDRRFSWKGITIHRTGGQHGTGEIGKMMAPVSGFVFEYQNQKLYIAGDTIWCPEVQDAIDQHQPNHIIVNGGAAQFVQGEPITMTTEDIASVLNYAPTATVTVVHLDTINHCYQTRAIIRQAFENQPNAIRLRIPEDGEWVTL